MASEDIAVITTGKNSSVTIDGKTIKGDNGVKITQEEYDNLKDGNPITVDKQNFDDFMSVYLKEGTKIIVDGNVVYTGGGLATFTKQENTKLITKEDLENQGCGICGMMPFLLGGAVIIILVLISITRLKP